MPRGDEAWFLDPAARTLIARRYLPRLAGLSLAWELLQLPLYTIWDEGSAARLAFAVAHCTAGDVLIGSVALAVALLATRARHPSTWNWRALALILAAVGVVYTGWSEWMNTVLRASWTYSRWMPTVRFGDVALGLSPLLQWLIVPPLALRLARGQR